MGGGHRLAGLGGGTRAPPQPYPSLLLLLLQVPLQDLLLVGNDAPDAADEAALVVGDEANEDLLLRRVQQHEHAHLARCLVGKMHAAGLAGTGHCIKDTAPPQATGSDHIGQHPPDSWRPRTCQSQRCILPAPSL